MSEEATKAGPPRPEGKGVGIGLTILPVKKTSYKSIDDTNRNIHLGREGSPCWRLMMQCSESLTLALIADRFPHTAWTHVYTDGSAEEGMKNGGSWVCIRYSDGDTTSLSVPGGLQCSNCRAEILAISTAAEHLLESRKKMGNKPSSPTLSTLQALNSADPDQMIQGLHSSRAKLTAQFTVSLQWVPAHVGLTGNEKADRLAKIGSQAPQKQNPVTYREAKTLLHSRYNGDWKKDNGGYQAHHDPIWRLERAQQTTIFRLRTGHCGLSGHLKRIGISDTSLCECGQADQTPDHVLQSCPKYAERRQLTWPQGADLTTKLWGSAEDLYRTAGFVASTGLKIWPAWLSIAEEEEEEEVQWKLKGSCKADSPSKRGRPHNSWRGDTKAEVKQQGTNWSGMARAAQNRVQWRGVVDRLCSTRSK